VVCCGGHWSEGGVEQVREDVAGEHRKEMYGGDVAGCADAL